MNEISGATPQPHYIQIQVIAGFHCNIYIYWNCSLNKLTTNDRKIEETEEDKNILKESVVAVKEEKHQ